MGGQALSRSFGAPTGCEAYASAARALFDRLQEDPLKRQAILAAGLAIGGVELRRGAMVLQLQGEPLKGDVMEGWLLHPSSREDVTASIGDVDVATEAFKKSAAAMLAIERALFQDQACGGLESHA